LDRQGLWDSRSLALGISSGRARLLTPRCSLPVGLSRSNFNSTFNERRATCLQERHPCRPQEKHINFQPACPSRRNHTLKNTIGHELHKCFPTCRPPTLTVLLFNVRSPASSGFGKPHQFCISPDILERRLVVERHVEHFLANSDGFLVLLSSFYFQRLW